MIIDERFTEFLNSYDDDNYDYNLEFIKQYVNKNNVNSIYIKGFTFLEYAIDTENLAIIEYLLSVGANTNQSNDSIGLLNRVIAQAMDLYNEDFTYVPDIEKLNLLIKYGADINKVDKKGYTPLEQAIVSGNYKAEDYLRHLGAKKSTLSILSSLHSGAEINLEEINENDYLPIEPSIDELKGCNGSIFHYDILFIWYLKEEKEKELEKILSFRTDDRIIGRIIPQRNFTDRKGRTPLDLALELGFKSAEPILRKYGEKTSKELK